MPPRPRIGCSGWTYDDWRGPFYPETVRQKDRFAFYATRFDTTEINGSFYRLPSEAAVARAGPDTAPDGFLFAWKVSRYITHNKKLKDCQDSVDLVFGRMKPLGEHRGPALVQLPPMLHRDDERLKRFLSWLPKGQPSPSSSATPAGTTTGVRILRDHGVAFCISDHHDAPSPWLATANFAYVRGHGPGGHYHGRYSDAELEAWAKQLAAWRAEGLATFSYFDNDVKSAAPKDADKLIALLA
jgi:uncharacterized protein YecE (DUF72 family)